MKSMSTLEDERNRTMNRMKRTTIGLLGAGLLLGVTAARAAEKAAGGDAEDASKKHRLALPWTELGAIPEPSDPLPKNAKEHKEYKERMERMHEDLTKRQGEVYKQIDEGKIDEAYPTVFDAYALEMWCPCGNCA